VNAIRFAVAVVAGALFGAGLLLSGMTDPGKVLGFLDITGAWDPRLAFVMVGAIGVHAIAYRWVRRRSRPLLDVGFHLPPQCTVDHRLIVGAAVFGAGWGLAGFCPGPGLVAAASGATSALVFVVAMLAGMLAHGAGGRTLRLYFLPSR
jgi:uncharacterized protein